MSDIRFPDLSPSFCQDLRRAIGLFVEVAYGPSPPPAAGRYFPPGPDFDAMQWLMGDLVERVPSGAPFEEVRMFHLRIGCRHYRHLKLRVSRPSPGEPFIFMVDSHDSFLQADEGSPDFEGIRELKRRNAEVVAGITDAWDRAGLNTERNYLREKIRRAREEAPGREGR